MAKLTNNYGDQPGFGRMAQAYQTISSELANSSNLPALDAGNEIKNAIKALDKKLDMMSTQINARLNGTHQTLANTNETLDVITERLGRLEQRQAASDHNQFARFKNSLLESSDDVLHPLHRTDNNPIDNFPPTIESIFEMTTNALDVLLKALDAPASGDLSEKRRNFALLIGIKWDLPAQRKMENEMFEAYRKI